MINSDRFWKIIDNADSFSKRGNLKELEFGWAQEVNLAFAVELYLKSIMEYEKEEIERGHNLKTLFKHLGNKTQNAIYNNWRTLSGTDIPDNKQIKDWFRDNLYACCNIFERFRYVHEWAGCNTNLETSWDMKQFNQLSIFSANHEFGKLQVYDGFLKEFENAVKKYIQGNVIPKLPRKSFDVAIDFDIKITRADGSTKTECNKVVTSLNIQNAGGEQ